MSRLYYTASIEWLTTRPTASDPRDQMSVTQWETIEKRADELGLPKSERISGLALANRAFGKDWALSNGALLSTWNDGDRRVFPVVDLRYAVLRSWGAELALRGTAQSRPQGIRLLATAGRLAALHGLSHRGEACADLAQLGYTDCAWAEADRGDPMLN